MYNVMVVKVYYSPVHREYLLQDALIWLDNHSIPYQLIPYQEMTMSQLLDILKITENGFVDILNKRANLQKLKQILKGDVEDATTLVLMKTLLNNTHFLIDFILVDGSHFQTKFKEDEMGKFIPKDVRRIQQQILIYR